MKVGIIGAGQLGRMLALAGYPLGLRFMFLDPAADAPGTPLGSLIHGPFAARERLAALADAVDVVTFDVENVPVEAIREIAARKPFRPPPDVLGISQDRLLEKRMFAELRIPTAPHAPVDSLGDLQQAVTALGLPGILKTRTLGYDGRGQYLLRGPADVATAWEALGSVPLIYEGYVNFSREVSVIGARSTRGEIRIYPLTANTHVQGILRHSIAPFRHAALEREAARYLRRILERFDYAGVLTIEFFVKRGRLIANELAPRVHNSGHWTIEGACTSQFENHLRGILGLPLGDTAPTGHAGMVNFIGTLPPAATVLGIPGVHLHAYGKDPRPGRKLGHATVVLRTAAMRDKILKRLLKVANREDVTP